MPLGLGRFRWCKTPMAYSSHDLGLAEMSFSECAGTAKCTSGVFQSPGRQRIVLSFQTAAVLSLQMASRCGEWSMVFETFLDTPSLAKSRPPSKALIK